MKKEITASKIGREGITKRKEDIINQISSKTTNPIFENDLSIAETKSYDKLMTFQIISHESGEGQINVVAKSFDEAIKRAGYKKADCEILDCFYEKGACLTDEDGNPVEYA